MNSDSRRGKGSGMDAKRVSEQRREGEADSPRGQRSAGINHKPDGVRQTGASGRSSVYRCGDDKPCRAKGLWVRSADSAEEAVRPLPLWGLPRPGHMRESAGKLNAGQTPLGGRARGRRPHFQPYWGKPTVRNDWRGLGKHGRSRRVGPSFTRLNPFEGMVMGN